MVVRGRDGELRAFHNVCRHRGTAIVEEPCGKVVRFQCPYHAWIYDLEGKLLRAKHTEDLDDFSFETTASVPVGCETWQGFVFLNLDPGGPAARRPARRPDRALRPVRLRVAPAGPDGSPTTSPRTGRSSPRTTPSATTARGSTRSSTS